MHSKQVLEAKRQAMKVAIIKDGATSNFLVTQLLSVIPRNDIKINAR